MSEGEKPVILCIDDYAVALMIRRAMFEQRGYEVVIADSGEKGLEIVRSRNIDLVISDHFLQGKTGGEIAREIKALRPNLPIVLLSGAVERPEGTEYADAFICKAEDRDVLFGTVASLLKTSASRVAI